jgi:hypothetical protein
MNLMEECDAALDEMDDRLIGLDLLAMEMRRFIADYGHFFPNDKGLLRQAVFLIEGAARRIEREAE